MQNIVTWGQNMSTNIEEFACFSMGGLFSGAPPDIRISPSTKILKSELHPQSRVTHWNPSQVQPGGD